MQNSLLNENEELALYEARADQLYEKLLMEFESIPKTEKTEPFVQYKVRKEKLSFNITALKNLIKKIPFAHRFYRLIKNNFF